MFRSVYFSDPDPDMFTLLAHFYVTANDVAKMPAELQVSLYRSTDKSLQLSYKLTKKPSDPAVFGNPCNPDTIANLYNFQYLGDIKLPRATYNDPGGYYFVTEPIGTRPQTANIQSAPVSLYLWFSPDFLSGQPDGSGPGKTSTFMLGNPILRCQKSNQSSQFNAYAYDQLVISALGLASPPPTLTVNIRLSSPLRNAAGGTLDNVSWKNGYSAANPLPVPSSTSLTAGPNNGQATLTITPSQTIAGGQFTIAAIAEQYNNGKKVSESLTEYTLIYTTCPKIDPPTITYTKQGSAPSATPPPICPGQSLTVSAPNGKANQEYRWFKDTQPITGQTNPTLTVNTPGNYRVRIMQAGVCDSASVQFTIPAAVAPTVTIVSDVSATTGCTASGPAMLSVSSPSTGSALTWYLGTSQFISTPDERSIQTKVNGVYSVVITSPDGCTARSNEITLNFTGPPSVSIAQPASTTFCPGATADLQTSLVNGYQYEWFRDGVTTGVTTYTIKSIDAGAYTVKVTVPGGCTALSAPVTMSSPALAKPAITGDPTVCLGKSLTLTATPAGLPAYQWFRDGTIEPGGTSPALSTSFAGQYTVRVTYPNGCTILSDRHQVLQNSTVPVSIVPVGPICGPSSIPIALSATPAGGTFSGRGVLGNLFIPLAAGIGSTTVTYTPPASLSGCTAGNATLVIAVRPLPLLNLPPVLETGPGIPTLLPGDIGAGYQYRWTPPLYLDNPAIGNATSTPAAPITYTLTVTDSFGCSVSDSVQVQLSLGFYVPTAFSPNSDGINDTWVLRGINDYPDIEVMVYSRWGEVVFYSKGYAQPFDGTYAGDPLLTGTYTYLIRLKPTEPPKRGTITILR